MHGSGGKENLVPLSCELNTNMETLVENFVKKAVGQDKVLYYAVEAHWEGCNNIMYDAFVQDVLNQDKMKAAYYHLSGAKIQGTQEAEAKKMDDYMKLKHPKQKVKKVEWDWPVKGWTKEMLHPFAMRRSFDGLVWGEQFAPTCLSWVVKECTDWGSNVSPNPGDHQFSCVQMSKRGDATWYNRWPT